MYNDQIRKRHGSPKEKLETALKNLSEFINSLRDSEEIDNDSLRDYTFLFSFKDEGTLFLNGKDLNLYRRGLRLLSDAATEIISARTVENLYQRAIFYTLDINEQRKDTSFDQRLEYAIDDLRSSLTAPLKTFLVYYPIHGLLEDGFPIRIGKVTFCTFDGDHLARFSEIPKTLDDDPLKKQKRSVFVDFINQSQIVGKPVGLLEIDALDADAAKDLAKKELTLILDIINFFSDILHFREVLLYLPGDRESVTINIPTITKEPEPKITFGNEKEGPIAPLSLKSLLEKDQEYKIGFSDIIPLLGSKHNKLQNKLISAIQWAGKANIANRKEDAFLLYVISLESLILNDSKGQLSRRLRTRVAHLLSDELVTRKEIFNNMGALYYTRSKIVHSGFYQVTEADLGLLV